MTPALPLWRACAHPLSLRSGELQVRLPGVAVDEYCQVRAGLADSRVLAHGIVNRVEQGVATLSLVGAPARLTPDMVVVPSGRSLTLELGEHLLGCVLDGRGEVVEPLSGAPLPATGGVPTEVAGGPLDYRRRRPIHAPFATGVRAMDALLPVGEGQRMGIFAAAGCGKTSLVEMLLANGDAGVRIVALIGERGREVAGFVAALRASPHAAQTIIVQATSDAAPSLRVNAALVATRLAEYFRDRGRRVLLVMDSVTRYARALRDVALARGEPPARRGYPASVFDALPRLLERPGATEQGSITAFYTVLLEDEADADPVGEEVKSLLDGHVYLASRLAQRGHYPAIDVLRSGSRLAAQLSTAPQLAAAAQVRTLLGRLDDLQLLRDIGEYQPGTQRDQDDAVACEPRLLAFLQQGMHERIGRAQALEALDAFAA